MAEARGFECRPTASGRQRRARQLAVTLTALACAATLLALTLAPDWLRAGAAACSVFALTLAVCPGRKRALPTILVDGEGRLFARRGDDLLPLAVRYCGARFVSLQSREGVLAIWPDSLAPDRWRRLLVACRWPRRSAAARSDADARGANQN